MDYDHLTHIQSIDELMLYELIPNAVWVFDLDKHGWWWGNEAALKFWGLSSLQELINKDLSGDTQGARERTAQTFEKAAKHGLSIDPWTTYPHGKPKTLHMQHRAVLIGPNKHRAIIAFINEEVSLGDSPENLLLVEAMRYTSVLTTSFTFAGEIVIENPAATNTYKHIDINQLKNGLTPFSARFANPDEGEACLQLALQQQGGRWTHLMNTANGLRKHTLDIRLTRHPLNGEFLLLMAEYDVTELHDALDKANQAQKELHKLAHYDAITELPSLNFLIKHTPNHFARADRANQKLAILFLDLDGFKSVNDTWGHATGNQVLKAVADKLTSILREADQLARIGGDEFLVIIDDVKNEQNALAVAEKIVTEMGKPFAVHGPVKTPILAHIGVSVGISLFPEHSRDLQQLIKIADQAMYKVKKNGKGGCSIATKPLRNAQ